MQESGDTFGEHVTSLFKQGGIGTNNASGGEGVTLRVKLAKYSGGPSSVVLESSAAANSASERHMAEE